MALAWAAVKFWALVGVAGLLLSACSPVSADMIKALSVSERSWCVSISTVYGTARVGGSGVQGGSVTCTQEGLSVTDKK